MSLVEDFEAAVTEGGRRRAKMASARSGSRAAQSFLEGPEDWMQKILGVDAMVLPARVRERFPDMLGVLLANSPRSEMRLVVKTAYLVAALIGRLYEQERRIIEP